MGISIVCYTHSSGETTLEQQKPGDGTGTEAAGPGI